MAARREPRNHRCVAPLEDAPVEALDSVGLGLLLWLLRNETSTYIANVGRAGDGELASFRASCKGAAIRGCRRPGSPDRGHRPKGHVIGEIDRQLSWRRCARRVGARANRRWRESG